MTNAPKYFVVPATMSRYWGDVFEYARLMYGLSGNDFNGCRTMTAESGKLVVKLDI